MIKTVVKHFIYEKCINVLMDTIAFNFLAKPTESREEFLTRLTGNATKNKDFFIDRTLPNGDVIRIPNPKYTTALRELVEIKESRMTSEERSIARARSMAVAQEFIKNHNGMISKPTPDEQERADRMHDEMEKAEEEYLNK